MPPLADQMAELAAIPDPPMVFSPGKVTRYLLA
jgi:hypothetical protein